MLIPTTILKPMFSRCLTLLTRHRLKWSIRTCVFFHQNRCFLPMFHQNRCFLLMFYQNMCFLPMFHHKRCFPPFFNICLARDVLFVKQVFYQCFEHVLRSKLSHILTIESDMTGKSAHSSYLPARKQTNTLTSQTGISE